METCSPNLFWFQVKIKENKHAPQGLKRDQSRLHFILEFYLFIYLSDFANFEWSFEMWLAHYLLSPVFFMEADCLWAKTLLLG